MEGPSLNNQSSLEICATAKQFIETNRCVDVISSNSTKKEYQITLADIITVVLAASAQHGMDSGDEIVVHETQQECRTTESEVYVDEDQIFENLQNGKLEEILARFEEDEAPSCGEDKAGIGFDVQEPQPFVFGPYFEESVEVFEVIEEDDSTYKLSTTEMLESDVYEYEVITKMIAVYEDLEECKKHIPFQCHALQSIDTTSNNDHSNIEENTLLAREKEALSDTCETHDKLSSPYEESKGDNIAKTEGKVKKRKRQEEKNLSTETEVEEHSSVVHEDQENIRPSLPVDQFEAALLECKMLPLIDEEGVCEDKYQCLSLQYEKEESDDKETVDIIHGDLQADNYEGVLSKCQAAADAIGQSNAGYGIDPYEDYAVEIIANEDIEEQVQAFYEESIVHVLEQINKEIRCEQTAVNDDSLIKTQTVVKKKNSYEDSPNYSAEEFVPGLKAEAPSEEENRYIQSSGDSIEMEDLVETFEAEDRPLDLSERCMTSQVQVNEEDVVLDTEVTRLITHERTQSRIKEDNEPADEVIVYATAISTNTAKAELKGDEGTVTKHELDYSSRISPVNKVDVDEEQEEIAGPVEECDISITDAKETDEFQIKEPMKEQQNLNVETEVEEILHKVYESLSISQQESAIFQLRNDEMSVESSKLYCNVRNEKNSYNEEELPEKIPNQFLDCEVDITDVKIEDVLESNVVSSNGESVISIYEVEENKDSLLDCFDAIVDESGTDEKPGPQTTRNCELLVDVKDKILENNSSLPVEANISDNEGAMREKQETSDGSDQCHWVGFYDEKDESFANKDRVTDNDSSTNVKYESPFPVSEKNWTPNKSRTTRCEHSSYEHAEVTISTTMTDENIAGLSENEIKQTDLSPDDVHLVNPKPKKEDVVDTKDENETSRYKHTSYEHAEVTIPNAMTDENITELSDNEIKQTDSSPDDVREVNPEPNKEEDTKVDTKEASASLETQDRPILIGKTFIENNNIYF